MRTFTCFTFEAASSVPTLSFIFAADEARARELVRRELTDAFRPVAVELHELGKLLWSAPAGSLRQPSQRAGADVRSTRARAPKRTSIL